MRTKLLVVMTLLMLYVGGAAYAYDQAFNVKIAIRQAISITVNRPLDFGLIDAIASAQALSIAATNAGAGTAGLNSTSAQFTITGDPAYPVTVSVLSPATNCDGANNLTFSLAESTGGAPTTLASTLPGTQVWVGGTVTVPANAVTGTFTCTGTLRVVYN